MNRIPELDLVYIHQTFTYANHINIDKYFDEYKMTELYSV